MTLKKVVIIGASYAGIPLAQSLEKSLDASYQVILIDQRSHFFHLLATVRGGTIEDMDDKLFIPFTNVFKKSGKFIQTKVVEIRRNAVVISPPDKEFGEVIEFEYLAVATGSSYSAPFKLNTSLTKEEGVRVLETSRAAVTAANDILIIGGGPVGSETAGEIKTAFPKKNVTIVHSSDLPISDALGPKPRQAIKVGLEKLGVKLILNDSVVLPEGGLGDGRQRRTLTTKKGVKIESDMQILSFGGSLNVAPIATLDPEVVGPGGIRIKPTFQVQGYDNIFALGDVADVGELKLAYKAGLHADVVAKNIVALTKKGALKEYKKGSSEVMLVTLGKNGGVAVLPGGITGGNWISRNLKAKNLMVDHQWSKVYGSSK
ncbi:hypothetical protein BC936DRAFT_146221 [Jimgerdemannia flammicorona]|uniref:Uncharacterized protein n=2 Tax=Jimgerdemannia flammicorona TaxID=994334 RepID=A0A433QH92_9FUNG|nr:hypothetical protein BC936DRAFT_146221 [Jimgerdemannia flammicorona]RUS29208.1 hypothetical protein BC938DRAFT_480919 [Jimgerdemannia flammicorona]